MNHGGDSDSTGALAGNLLGAMGGTEALPPDWVERLEVRDLVTTVAEDLAAQFAGFASGRPVPDLERYPPW